MATQPSQGLAQRLPSAWAGRGPLACLLWPLSLLYRALTALRRTLYRMGLLQVAHAKTPVIVVGNVVAGGAGKTPTTIAIARHLAQRGLQVGIVSRGYGRNTDDCREVDVDADPQQVGDEPLLLRRATGCPVFVAASRHQAAQALLARYPEIDVLICDDGLQHLALYRDLEICVFDERGTGNGWLLPAGPLREPWPRALSKRSGQNDANTVLLNTGPNALPGFRATRALADHALRADGTQVPLQDLSNMPCVAIAGIARPEAFFTMLRAQGLALADAIALPDHFDFQGFKPDVAAPYHLLCTEKDAAKLWALGLDALAVPLVQTAEPAFFAALDAQVGAWGLAKLSSPHGHPTT